MKHLVSLLLVLLASSTLQADDTIHINFMAYNVENFFDCQHDTLKDDWAFTPKGANRWTPERYRRKAENIARVIVAAGGWNPPALVALCEVENERVMNTLCDQLKVLDYSYFITHSHDRRGIDVALLYRTEYFTPLQSRSISIKPTSTEQRPTRDILHVSGRLADCRDTLDLFICHFPSRSGGARKTEGYRLQAARTLKQAADSVARQRKSPCLLIMGDFNDYPDSPSIRRELQALPPSDNHPVEPRGLYHLLANKAARTLRGSYLYQKEWNLLDHIIVSGHLLQPDNPLHTHEQDADIFSPGFLLKNGQPFRTYKGPDYMGGFSDHLPVTGVLHVWKKGHKKKQ